MTKIKDIYVYHHSHLDVGYTHAQPVLLALQHTYMDQAIDLCEQTESLPEESRFYWTCEATAPVLNWLKQADAAQVKRFEKYIKNGQIALTAMYAHTSPLCSAEQLARMLYPVHELRSRFGIPIHTAINHDINGQPWTLSQMLLDAGVKLYMTGINIHFGGFPLERPRVFRWTAPDGRKLLCFNGEHYGLFTQIAQLWEKSTRRMKEGLDAYMARIVSQGYPYDFIVLSTTNVPFLDNTPPDPELMEMVSKWNAEGHRQRIRLVTPEFLYQRLLDLPPDQVSEHAGDWTDYWNFGAASSAAETRLNRRTKISMRTADFLSAVAKSPDDTDRRLSQEAWDQVNLYDEHTWGANISVNQPDDLFTRTLWMHKAHYAYQANSMASLWLNRKLEQLAGNPLQSGQPNGLLLVNPTPVEQKIELFLPAGYESEGRQTSSARFAYHQNNYDPDRTGPYKGSRTLPPFSCRTVPFKALPSTETVCTAVTESGLIDTDYYTFRFDPVTGRILELTDKKLNWQLLDKNSPWTLFQYVHEMPDPLLNPNHRTTLYDRIIEKANANISCWNPDWKALRRGADKLVSHQVDRHGSGVTAVFVWEGPGISRLEQRITFFTDKPGIELLAIVDKPDIRDPESIYFAFPLNLGRDWQAVFDSAGTYVKLDEDQLPGVCRDWVTVDQTVSVFDDSRGVTLACPDAPLVQIGGFHFGKEQKTLPREAGPILLAWPMNNYWDTNFRASQPGKVSFKYVLHPFAQFDAAIAAEHGLAACCPVQMFPVVNCKSEMEKRLLTMEGEGMSVLHVKPSEGRDGIIIRMTNIRDSQSEVMISIPDRMIAAAYVTDIMERQVRTLPVDADGRVKVSSSPREMMTVHLQADAGGGAYERHA